MCTRASRCNTLFTRYLGKPRQRAKISPVHKERNIDAAKLEKSTQPKSKTGLIHKLTAIQTYPYRNVHFKSCGKAPKILNLFIRRWATCAFQVILSLQVILRCFNFFTRLSLTPSYRNSRFASLPTGKNKIEHFEMFSFNEGEFNHPASKFRYS